LLLTCRWPVQLWQFAFVAPHMAAPMKALLLLLLAASCSSTRSSLFADDEATLSENAKNCIFLYKARPAPLGLLHSSRKRLAGQDKVCICVEGASCARLRPTRLLSACRDRLQGLQAPGGYYRVTQPVGEVAYTFWFQARVRAAPR